MRQMRWEKPVIRCSTTTVFKVLRGGKMSISISTIVSMIGMWFVFVKMGFEGWRGIIPIYNVYLMFKQIGYSGFMMLWLLVPIANIVVTCLAFIRLSKAFSMPKAFALGLLLLNPIFICILGFNESRFNPEFIYC